MRGPTSERPPSAARLALAFTLALAAATTASSCGRSSGRTGGSGDDGAGAVTGRVMALDAERYCVSPDRGRTQTCVDIPDPKAVQGVDVGECVTTTPNLTAKGSFVKVVDDAKCAAGDLGETEGD
jgi:hypothetical protein